MKNEDLIKIEEILGYKFNNKMLLQQAFTRESYAIEKRMKGIEVYSNEVLEYFGDKTLNYIVSINSFRNFCTINDQLKSTIRENKLTNFCSYWTNKDMLSSRINSLDLSKYLIMNTGDLNNNVQNSESVKEDLFESIVGALWIDSNNDISKIEDVILNMLDINYEEGTTQLNPYSELLILKEKRIIDLQEVIIEFEDGFLGTFTYKINDNNKSGAIIKQIASSKRKLRNKTAIKILDNINKQLMYNSLIPKFDIDNAINVLQELYQKNIIDYPSYYGISIDNQWELTCNIKGYQIPFIHTSPSKNNSKKHAAYQALLFIMKNLHNHNYNPINKKVIYICNEVDKNILVYEIDSIKNYKYTGYVINTNEYDEIDIDLENKYVNIFDNIIDCVSHLIKLTNNYEIDINYSLKLNALLEMEYDNIKALNDLDIIDRLLEKGKSLPITNESDNINHITFDIIE